jgi:hypothetical protein
MRIDESTIKVRKRRHDGVLYDVWTGNGGHTKTTADGDQINAGFPVMVWQRPSNKRRVIGKNMRNAMKKASLGIAEKLETSTRPAGHRKSG